MPPLIRSDVTLESPASPRSGGVVVRDAMFNPGIANARLSRGEEHPVLASPVATAAICPPIRRWRGSGS